MFNTRIEITLVTGEKIPLLLESEKPIRTPEELVDALSNIFFNGNFYIFNGIISAAHVVSIRFEEEE
ncbi:hypothetical protein [Neobacillus niacini]|uniref:hypothetical protein n=1 Tax=Neobacillus niacini TaxID=86668 RepID=UPI0028656D2A|nr:hypothetical protein [Neobacillus niacini]MDR7001614.1 hypothetical protein [Neobacillus niacini]